MRPPAAAPPPPPSWCTCVCCDETRGQHTVGPGLFNAPRRHVAAALEAAGWGKACVRVCMLHVAAHAAAQPPELVCPGKVATLKMLHPHLQVVVRQRRQLDHGVRLGEFCRQALQGVTGSRAASAPECELSDARKLPASCRPSAAISSSSSSNRNRPAPTVAAHLQVLQRLCVVVHVHAERRQEEASHEVVGQRQLAHSAHVAAHRLERLQVGRGAGSAGRRGTPG